MNKAKLNNVLACFQAQAWPKENQIVLGNNEKAKKLN